MPQPPSHVLELSIHKPGAVPSESRIGLMLAIPLGKNSRIPAFQVAGRIDPEMDVAEVEAAAGGLLAFGEQTQAVQFELVGIEPIARRARRPGAEVVEDRVGLVMSADDAAHAAADVGDERLPRGVLLADAVDGLHAIELRPGSELDAGILPQTDGSVLGRGPTGRMRQAHEVFAVEIDRESPVRGRRVWRRWDKSRGGR